MANWKEIKRRIKSIENTAKITKAMELISTVKMKKAQDTARAKKDFVISLLEVLAKMWATLDDFPLFEQEKKDEKTLWVIITSNKWLCWGYNVNTFKQVNNYIKENGDNIAFITCWKRWAQFISRTWFDIISDFSENFSDNMSYEFSKNISKLFLEKFQDWSYWKIVIFYTHFVNTLVQIPMSREFLPIRKDDIKQYLSWVLGKEKCKFLQEDENNKENVYNFEPTKEEILKEVMPMIIDMMFYDVLLEAKASEHSARMIAMKSAKDNAKKYASRLTLEYNKTRQASITSEVSEIVSWVESMKEV